MSTPRISRREFLKVAGVSLGASALAGSALGCAAGGASQSAPQIETPEFVYGKEGATDKRILVTYATRTGSSVDVAAAIGETLSRRGFAVDVKPIKDHPALDGYQTVLMGSAINGAQWLPEAVEFVKSNQAALNQVPVALFSVHIMNLGDDDKSKKNRLAYLNAVRPLLKPADEAFFAGIGMNPEEQGKLVRWVYRTFKIGPEGDCRDWEKIRGWAEAVRV
jgi:menaquinone-dependent protoporphyrinogen oxidase